MAEEFFDILKERIHSSESKEYKKVNKGARRMPRLSETTKDVISCEKLRGFANRN